jgi:ribosomal protein S18 acetylase RimI-like enzyme
MLLQAAEETARSHGAQELRLDVAKGNARAIAAYVSHGYEAVVAHEEPDSLERMFSRAL